MRRVILESPWAGLGGGATAVEYGHACLRDCLNRGESPFAAHLLLARGALDDLNPVDRERGLQAHLAWLAVADAMVVYEDHGRSPGMDYAVAVAERLGLPVEVRRLGGR